MPSVCIPACFCTSVFAASCQVRPLGPGWVYGRMLFQVSKTALTLAPDQSSLPAIRLTWKSYPLSRMLM